MSFAAEPGPVEFGFRTVAKETVEDLAEHHVRARVDYERWKQDFLEWLHYEGKDPERLRGYAESTVRMTSYKTDRVMRWLWNERGYTTELTPEDADALMRELGRYTASGDANLLNYVKTIKRIFAYYNYEKGKNYEWDCKLKLHEPEITNRDYFKKEEFRPLYEAALEYGTVKHYHSCSVGERDRVKAHLAQRFEMPKDEVGEAEFDRANSFKIPSLVSVSLDCGLRPVEVKRAKVSWVNLDDATLDIPREDSSKNENNWKCVLSSNSMRALELWLEERASYEKYDGSDALWLNKRGKPYRSSSLNPILRSLIEAGGIRPAGRDLSWYSIRHGVATVWADDESIHDAREQLRHKKYETTLRYVHAGTETRHGTVNSKW